MCVLKVCGITSVDDALTCAKGGVHCIGLNFCPSSPRYIDVDTATTIVDSVKKMHSKIRTVAIFQNEDIEKVLATVIFANIDIIQLHGDEDREYRTSIKAKSNKEIIQAVRVQNSTPYSFVAKNFVDADYLLLDSFHPHKYGGTGIPLNHDHAQKVIHMYSGKKVFLAGGIGPHNIQDYLSLSPYGIDVNSGVESSTGHKDARKIDAVMSATHEWNQQQ